MFGLSLFRHNSIAVFKNICFNYIERQFTEYFS